MTQAGGFPHLESRREQRWDLGCQSEQTEECAQTWMPTLGLDGRVDVVWGAGQRGRGLWWSAVSGAVRLLPCAGRQQWTLGPPVLYIF